MYQTIHVSEGGGAISRLSTAWQQTHNVIIYSNDLECPDCTIPLLQPTSCVCAEPVSAQRKCSSSQDNCNQIPRPYTPMFSNAEHPSLFVVMSGMENHRRRAFRTFHTGCVLRPEATSVPNEWTDFGCVCLWTFVPWRALTWIGIILYQLENSDENMSGFFLYWSLMVSSTEGTPGSCCHLRLRGIHLIYLLV